MKSIYEFEPDPRSPPDVQRAVLAARELLRAAGVPPRGPDGAHQVLVVFALANGLEAWLDPFEKVLVEMECPEVLRALRRAAELAIDTPQAVVLLAIGREGNYWCAALGGLTGATIGDA